MKAYFRLIQTIALFTSLLFSGIATAGMNPCTASLPQLDAAGWSGFFGTVNNYDASPVYGTPSPFSYLHGKSISYRVLFHGYTLISNSPTLGMRYATTRIRLCVSPTGSNWTAAEVQQLRNFLQGADGTSAIIDLQDGPQFGVRIAALEATWSGPNLEERKFIPSFSYTLPNTPLALESVASCLAQAGNFRSQTVFQRGFPLLGNGGSYSFVYQYNSAASIRIGSASMAMDSAAVDQ